MNFSDLSLNKEYDNIDELLTTLIKNRDEDIEYFENEIIQLDDYQNIFCCETFIYDNQINVLYEDIPDKIKKKSISQFLYSCFKKNNTINNSCIPECIMGLKNPNFVECKSSIYVKHDQNILKINKIISDYCILFLDYNQTFTKVDSLYFKNKNLIIYKNKNKDNVDYEIFENSESKGYSIFVIIIMIVVFILFVIIVTFMLWPNPKIKNSEL